MDRVKLKVLGLLNCMSQAGAYALVLTDENDTYRIPIIIGTSEAQSIAIQLEHLKIQRPLTHDLFKQVLDRLGVILEQVYIYHWESGIFYAKLALKNGEEKMFLDARTSDAIALALRFGSPIYAAQDVIDATAIDRELDGEYINKKSVRSKPEITIEDLKRKLDEAIRKEDYENASRYRDMLKARESE